MRGVRPHVAVVGAGMAGLVAARHLADAGCAVAVFEKSRGLGGRCATRRSDFGPFNHGVARFTAVSARFRAEIAGWQACGWVGPDVFLAATGSAAPAAPALHPAHGWTGLPTMNALARHLAHGLAVHTDHTVQALQRVGDGRWRLLIADHGTLETPFDSVLLAVPAEQALPLCAPSPGLQQALQQVRSQPCWTLMLAWAETSLGPAPRLAQRARGSAAARVTDQPTDEVLADLPGEVMADLPDDVLDEVLELRLLAGPMSSNADAATHVDPMPGTRWVLHAQPAWSAAHLDLAAADAIPLLMQALAKARGSALPPPARIAAHRWRYARVAAPLLEACGWDATLRLGCAGDAWAGAPSEHGVVPDGVERAWLSGLALAAAALGAA